METKDEIIRLAKEYVEKFPEQKEEAEPLIGFLNSHEGASLIDRKNFTGHITTSAFIIDSSATALLLLKHKFLNRWLQPGGHADATDATLLASAVREAKEETGLELKHFPLFSSSIFDINSHFIPENSRKQEPSHVHHDIRYLFQCRPDQVINISLEESADSRWVSFKELERDRDFSVVVKKILAALES
ncbi:MAG: NUDIX hydrolase [Bacteroidota bacterium]|nr:NUDIX hydrolase [Bacteroidota bacterium]